MAMEVMEVMEVMEEPLSLPLNRLDLQLSTLSPLEYGGAVVGWVGPRAIEIPVQSMLVKVMMNGVIYALMRDSPFGYPSEFPELDTLWRSKFEIILNLPPSSVDVSPLGDELVFTERTQSTIQALTLNVVTLLHHHARKLLNSQATRTAALSILAGFAESPVLNTSGFTWRGERLPLKLIPPPRQYRQRTTFLTSNEIHCFMLNSFRVSMRKVVTETRVDVTPFERADPYDFFVRKRVKGNHFVNVVVSSEVEYAEAREAIESGCLAYKSAKVSDDKLLMVVLSYADEPLLEWLGIRKQLSLAEFKRICANSRKYRLLRKITNRS